jgi:dehydrogenase/reductase SDR family member 7B
MTLKDKIVIITGASSGIGKALAFEMASKGAKLAIAARNEVQLNETVQQIKSKYKVEVLFVKCDVSREEDCKNLISQTLKTYGKIDVLINNAGISMLALFNDCDLSVIKQIMDINFWGTVYCTKYALRYLLESKGSVAGVSSIAGYKGLPGRTGYSASKFAIRGFLESLRIENLKKGLHVLIACPGFTTSNIRNTALGKDGNQQGESPRDEAGMMSAEKVAELIVRAIEQHRRTLILTRQGKLTVLMNKFFPGWMDKQVFNHMSKEPGSPF